MYTDQESANEAVGGERSGLGRNIVYYAIRYVVAVNDLCATKSKSRRFERI